MAATAGSNAATTNPLDISKDPFAASRAAGDNPFDAEREGDTPGQIAVSPPNNPGIPRDRRMSKEWDASKVPPSRFQKREGSIFSTPGSRDAHVSRGSDRDKSFHEKLKEKGWLK